MAIHNISFEKRISSVFTSKYVVFVFTDFQQERIERVILQEEFVRVIIQSSYFSHSFTPTVTQYTIPWYMAICRAAALTLLSTQGANTSVVVVAFHQCLELTARRVVTCLWSNKSKNNVFQQIIDLIIIRWLSTALCNSKIFNTHIYFLILCYWMTSYNKWLNFRKTSTYHFVRKRKRTDGMKYGAWRSIEWNKLYSSVVNES